MGTTAYVAEPTETGWRGRIVQYDGYDDNMVPVLQAIVVRDGVDEARQVLIHDQTEWAELRLDVAGPRVEGKHVAVPGYGMAYAPGEAYRGMATQEDAGQVSWVYVLHDDYLQVIRTGDGSHKTRDIPYA